ncbi:unnamed protein product [Bathycoccus prasinos]
MYRRYTYCVSALASPDGFPLCPACCQDSSTISRTDGFNASEIFFRMLFASGRPTFIGAPFVSAHPFPSGAMFFGVVVMIFFSLDVTIVFVETSIHFVYTLHKWSRQWSKSSACAKSHVCLHFIAACIAAWCNFNTSKYSSSVLISALFTR